VGLFLFLRSAPEGILSASKSRIATVVAVVAAIFLFFGISSPAQSTSPTVSPSPAVATHEVMDEMGRTLHVPVNPARIISLAPSLTETIYALGVEDRLVGDTDYCDYPPDAQKKPKVGGAVDPSMEQIVALHPDLVLVTKAVNRLDTVRELDNLGIPSYATDPHKVSDILASTEKLAEVLNVADAGKTVVDDMQKRLTALQAKLNGVPPRRVLFVVWTEPLISIGKSTFVADAMEKAGAVSIIDSSQDWPQVSMEEVAHLQPDYLVFAEAHGAAEPNLDSLASLPGWRILNAVRDRHFAVISDAIIRPAPRIVSAVEDLAHQLHAEAFVEPAPSAPEKTPPSINSASANASVVVAEESGPYSLTEPVDACASISADSVEMTCAH
jgi:iron complex transport system substrate-binding protein